MLLHAYVRPRDRVLDFACGKGGDLTKYRKAEVGSYVGVDIALESVRRDAVERYNGGDYPFPARFVAGDCFTADLTTVFEPRAFDVVSCQFAVHYSWSTEERARRSFRNVAKLLRPGGHFIGTTVDANVLVRKLRAADGAAFGNAIVEVRFADAHRKKLFPTRDGPFGLRYAFTLQDAVTDCDEWLVPRKSFVALAEEYGLELVEFRNFHEFARAKLAGEDRSAFAAPGGTKDERSFSAGKKTAGKQAPAETARDTWRQSFGGRAPEDATLSEDEWEAANLYATFAFRLAGTPESAAKAVLNRAPPGAPEKIHPRDVLVLEGAA